VTDGKAQTQFPFASSVQATCGPAGTDGRAGCFRSVVAQFKNGRVGLVEIAHASMRTAARILVRMHVKFAWTGDAGGSSLLAWRHGRGRGCASADRVRSRWSCMGVTHSAGLNWERPVPDVIVLVRRPL
jgi:hypothetical protein